MSVEIARFLIVGSIGFTIDLGTFATFSYYISTIPARFMALLIAITATWWLNRSFTFNQNSNDRRLAEWALYVLASIAGAGVNALVSLSAIYSAPQLETFIAVSLGSLAGLAINYLAAKHITFRTMQ